MPILVLPVWRPTGSAHSCFHREGHKIALRGFVEVVETLYEVRSPRADRGRIRRPAHTVQTSEEIDIAGSLGLPARLITQIVLIARQWDYFGNLRGRNRSLVDAKPRAYQTQAPVYRVVAVYSEYSRDLVRNAAPIDDVRHIVLPATRKVRLLAGNGACGRRIRRRIRKQWQAHPARLCHEQYLEHVSHSL
jgi:hypothetical protein